MGPKSKAKKNKNGPRFWTPLPPHLRGPNNAPPKINERGKKAFLTGIILYKRKGGIRPYKALQGLVKAL